MSNGSESMRLLLEEVFPAPCLSIRESTDVDDEVRGFQSYCVGGMLQILMRPSKHPQEIGFPSSVQLAEMIEELGMEHPASTIANAIIRLNDAGRFVDAKLLLEDVVLGRYYEEDGPGCDPSAGGV